MRKKLLVIGVVVIALLGFSGIVSSSVYMQYWDTMNSKGWIFYGGLVPGYTFYGKYHYNDHMVWKEFNGEIYMPTHENWHINYDTKCLDGNKPITIVHYNFMYQLDYTPTKYKRFWMGYFHAVDPKASDLAYYPDGRQAVFYYSGLTPSITKYMNHVYGEPPYGPPGGGKYPTIEDTTTLIDFIFNNLDFTLIPLIDRIDLYDIDGNVLTINISLLTQQ
jgi:hypothetical protein